MARIRTIKPEFPQSESMGRVSRDSRLLFIQLWTLCDDSGRTRGNSRMLASLLFPYDDDAPGLIDGWLAELEREECIVRYVVDGATYIQICNWLNHQKIDKPSESKIPPFDESSRILANPSGRIKDQGSRIKDQGRDQGPVTDAPSAPAPSSRIWDSYRTAYRARYGTDPVRNAKVNSILKRVRDRLGEEEAPAVVEFYVAHNKNIYVSSSHSVELLVRDCEGLRTEWKTGRQSIPQTRNERFFQALKGPNQEAIDGDAIRID